MIYLDHAATTPVDKEVYNAMKPYFTEKYGNPSSIYTLGQEAKTALEESRWEISNILGAKPEEIIFTSGATESNNLAIKGATLCHGLTQIQKELRIDTDFRPHIITSAIEHHSVLDAVKYLEKYFDFEVTYLPVDKEGVVDIGELEKSIKNNTVLVSIMHANNEVGTIEPIEKIGSLIKNEKLKRKNEGNDLPIVFHTDAVQSFQYLDTNVDKLGVDMLSLTGHKFYGPKGVGILYVRKGTKFLPQQQGGAQERKRRAGTENVPYIVGMAKAMKVSRGQMSDVGIRTKKLRDKLIKGVLEKIPNAILAGHPTKRLPHNAAFCFKKIEGESILINLDFEGIAASSGSACTSGSLEPSHVLLAMGYDHETAHGSIRFTFGKENTEADVDYVLEKLPPIIEKLRNMSPLK
ncbi:cysteine desulfurase NifS [bacterium (Candidatus Howlettbacteria) CG_4_10_14_0_8_um_filter_40_9]|nr:MAG: cysteine desulfurase NifS [bacterium (Candidatus Howlettbacteria) CG_4_10_14_0_8_um_filter_40_9]